MNVLRFTDLIAQGRVAGQRVFIRADLNVPQDDAGRITEDTRIRASVPCIRMALDAGAAVMVTSHLGRPTEGEFKPEDSLAPVAARLAELLGREVPLRARLGRRRRRRSRARSCCWRTAASTRARRRTTRRWRSKMAALCDIFVHDAFGTAHRAEATTYGIAQFAKVACAGPLLAAEIDAITQGAGAARSGRWWRSSPARKVSTKLTILQSLAEQGRPADRRRRHRQHLHAGGRPADRQVAGRARPGRRGQGRDRGDEGARRRGADPGRRGHAPRRSRPMRRPP